MAVGQGRDDAVASGYETFEHQADIGIRGFGATMEEAFANAATARSICASV